MRLARIFLVEEGAGHVMIHSLFVILDRSWSQEHAPKVRVRDKQSNESPFSRRDLGRDPGSVSERRKSAGHAAYSNEGD
jgi:hypothetical protein